MVFYAAKRLKVKIEDDMSNWQLEILATFRFLDKDDYENEIFPILCTFTSVILTWDQAQFERFSYILSNGYR